MDVFAKDWTGTQKVHIDKPHKSDIAILRATLLLWRCLHSEVMVRLLCTRTAFIYYLLAIYMDMDRYRNLIPSAFKERIEKSV